MNNYVYAHYTPNSDTPFYIGKGTGKRAWMTRHRSSFWKNIVRKYGRKVVFLHKNLSPNFALQLEANYIACYGRRDLKEGPLVNLSDGWNGSLGMSKISRKKMSQSRKRVAASGRGGMSGKKQSAETRKKISMANKGQTAHNKGKRMSEATKRKISQAMRLRNGRQ